MVNKIDQIQSQMSMNSQSVYTILNNIRFLLQNVAPYLMDNPGSPEAKQVLENGIPPETPGMATLIDELNQTKSKWPSSISSYIGNLAVQCEALYTNDSQLTLESVMKTSSDANVLATMLANGTQPKAISETAFNLAVTANEMSFYAWLLQGSLTQPGTHQYLEQMAQMLGQLTAKSADFNSVQMKEFEAIENELPKAEDGSVSAMQSIISSASELSDDFINGGNF